MADGSALVPIRYGGGAWTPRKVELFTENFYEFLRFVRIDSKETGGDTPLYDNIYDAQQRLLDALWAALANDVHDLKCLKSRQLGISTICKPLVLFWMGVHDGIQGGMIFDTDQHKEAARTDIEDMIEGLPERFRFPGIKGRNRYGLRLTNRSFLHFMAAGVKNSRSAGVLGRSSGLALIWASEVCSWNNDEGLASLKSSVAQDNPNRLYLWESTARGPGIWKEMVEEAKEDELNQAFVFIGWWAKETQRLREGSPAFARYGADPPTAEEQKRIDAVAALYGFAVDREQLAWYRRFSDPLAKGETGAPDPQDGLIQQDQPWTEHEAFILSGSTFFSNDRLNQSLNAHASKDYKAYKFTPAVDFTSCHIDKARTWRESELRVWLEPEPNHTYVIACDPAYGHSEKNDTSAVEVFDCYADCLEQAAEYRSGSILPHQLAWLVWTLVGWYGSGSGQGVLVIIELNGPGEAVWREVGLTRAVVQNGYLKAAAREKGIQNIFQNARQYIYGRSDAMNPGHNYHWKAVSLSTTLPTPDGWITMGDVEDGQELFDDEGKICTVTATSEVIFASQCYEILFGNGTSIVADAGHLWQVLERMDAWHCRTRVVTTEELIPSVHFIIKAAALDLPDAQLTIDPYVLGVWLGDGDSAAPLLTCHADDLEELTSQLNRRGYATEVRNVYEPRPSIRRVRAPALRQQLASLDLLNNKRIPSKYLRASIEQRLELLRGLMDTDGNVDRYGQCGFTTTSPILAKQFAELTASLGIKAGVLQKTPTLLGEDGREIVCSVAHQFWFTTDGPYVFNFERKRAREAAYRSSRAQRRKNIDRIGIVSVLPVASVPVKCVQVDSPSRLYLVGEGMVPTHNTTSQLKVAAMERLRDYLHQDAIVLRSVDLITEMRDITRDGDAIEAEGRGKDDRTFATAMAVRGYEEKLRRGLIARNATKKAAVAAKRLSMTDQVALYNQYHLENFFKTKSTARIMAQTAMLRAQRGW